MMQQLAFQCKVAMREEEMKRVKLDRGNNVVCSSNRFMRCDARRAKDLEN